MIPARLVPGILRQIWRRPVRSGLTAAGVAVAMFLFVAVQTLQRAVSDATTVAARDTTLIVYRENRFCPATSRLPEHYLSRISRIDGVASVVPMKIVVNNCRASLDVVTFRGITPADQARIGRSWRVAAGGGDLSAWAARSDSAIVGRRLADRRGFRPGQAFDASGITVTVAAIIESDQPQDENVAYVHLDFLQRASRSGGPGIVTQFNVSVDDPARLDEIARAIDDEFRTDSEPTTTRPERAFIAQAGADVVSLVRFTGLLAWGCLAAVLALVANAITLSVQDRIREHAVLQTVGFRPGLLARLIIFEGLLIGLAGGCAGAAAAVVLVRLGNFSLSSEGLSINISPDPVMFALGLAVSAGAGVLAGLVPAVRASRREIASCLRAA